jgi:signal peptidase I
MSSGLPVSSDQNLKVSWLRRLTIGRNPRVTIVRAVILGLITFVVFKTTLLPIRVTGISMLPSYKDGRRNFINRLAYKNHPPTRGDVVGVRYAGPSLMLLKRVVGLPGERIGFSSGHVTVNGKSLDEPYPLWPSNWEREPIELGPDEYFVVGDNRTMPMKDHTFGVAKRERILGKILL